MTSIGLIQAGSPPPGLTGSATGIRASAAALTGAYGLLIGMTLAVSFANLSGYSLSWSHWSLSAYGRLDAVGIKAIAIGVAIAAGMAVFCSGAALCTVALAFWYRRQSLVIALSLPGFLCCPALRAIALPTLTNQWAGPTTMPAAWMVNVGFALLCAGATAFPLCLAICLLGASGRLARYFEIYRNLGGSAAGGLRLIALPTLRPSVMISFLVAMPTILFDPYSLRVAGAQALPSVGALLSDLRSASDWPLIAVVCLLSLLVLLPFYALMLPAVVRQTSLD